MALIGHTLINDPVQCSGYVRFHVEFTFDNGEPVRRMSVRVPNEAAIPAKITELETSATREAKRRFAMKAIEDGAAIVASGEATANEVLREYLLHAFYERDMLKAFKMFQRIRTYVQAQGYTWDQVKTFSEMRDKDWNALKARVDYFQLNITAINNFLSISDAYPGA